MIQFILEGIATVIAGVISFWMIQDFPDNAKFLTEAERKFVIRRLQEDFQFSAAGEIFQWKVIRHSSSRSNKSESSLSISTYG
jgi:hypothetical protein